MAKEMNFNLPKEDSSIIKVIGVGGGGSNAVNHMYRQGIRGVDFVVCNTDQQALDMSPVPKKIALGSSLTEGRGAGAQAEVGRNAAIENLDEIKEVLENNTKMVFITAGMGGGTGTGAAPVIAEAARELGILTVGIVTIPFTFEGRKRKNQAEKGLEELKKHVDTVLVICNDKLRDMYGNLTLRDAFDKADDVLSIGAKGIAEIITIEGYVNVDFEDVRTVMTNSGVAIMGSATTSGEDRASKAVEQALASPLLNDNNIFGASNILLYINSGKDEVTMDEVAEITDHIQEEAGLDADVIWGNGSDEDLGDKLSITIIATGFSGDKREKIEGNEGLKKMDLYAKGSGSPSVGQPKEQLPAGLTNRPVLLNKHLEPTSEGENTAVGTVGTVGTIESTATNDEETVTETTATEPVIKHSLIEEKPELMAFKMDETDKELNAMLDKEAPEMIGTPVDADLPTFNDDDDGGQPETTEVEETVEMETEETVPTETTETVMAESTINEVSASAEETENIIPEFPAEDTIEPVKSTITSELIEDENTAESEDTFQKTELRFGLPSEETEDEEKDTDNVITTETATEVEFDLNNGTTETKEEITTFNLFDDTVETPTNKVEEPTSEEPKLITRNEPLQNDFDSEEMQKKQQDRMEKLKARMQRFRSPNSLAELENVPAFKRRDVNLEDVPHSSESSVSNMEVKDGDETDENGNKKGGLSDGNSFLHESVD